MRQKNECAKTRHPNNAYEIWSAPSGSQWVGWSWHVLKKWQIDDDKPHARWFCMVYSPIVPDGEMGDVYVSEIKHCAVRVK